MCTNRHNTVRHYSFRNECKTKPSLKNATWFIEKHKMENYFVRLEPWIKAHDHFQKVECSESNNLSTIDSKDIDESFIIEVQEELCDSLENTTFIFTA